MVESSDGGRSSESRVSSSRSAPAAVHSPRWAGYACSPRDEPCHRAYISDAVGGDECRTCSPNRSSSGNARGSGSVPSRAMSRWATCSLPDSSAPHVTSAAELPATSAISADRGPAGRGQRHQQERRGPQEGVPVGPPATRTPDQNTDDRGGERNADAGYDAPPGVALRSVPPKERRGRNDEGRNRDQERELPDEPKSDGHPSGRRGDPASKAADEVRRDASSRADANHYAIPAARKPPSPEPHPRHREQDAGEAEDAGRPRQRPQERAKEGGRREKRLQVERGADRSPNREPQQKREQNESFGGG